MATCSARVFTDTPGFSRPQAEQSWRAYLGSVRRGGSDVPADAAPARASNLNGLPPTYVRVNQFDPFRDEDIAFAQTLADAGAPVELHPFPGTFHGSERVADATISRQRDEEVVVLRRAREIPDPDGSGQDP